MGEEGKIFNSLKKKKNFGDDRWWLSLFECIECSQTWLVACEQRIYDVYFLFRLDSDETNQILLTHIWPDRFKLYRDLLQQAVEVGCSVSYIDPLNSLEIYWTIVDVALADPEISIFELEELLPIDIDTVEAIAKKALKEPGVFIKFDR